MSANLLFYFLDLFVVRQEVFFSLFTQTTLTGVISFLGAEDPIRLSNDHRWERDGLDVGSGVDSPVVVIVDFLHVLSERRHLSSEDFDLFSS